MKQLEGPLFFGATSSFTASAQQIPIHASKLIIRLEKVPYIDQSGLYALENVILDLVQKGKQVLLVGINKQPQYMLERIDLIPNLVANDQVFREFYNCKKWLLDRENKKSN